MANRSKYGVDLSPKGKAKRTYSGITFRSLLERDWAVHLDAIKACWVYEPTTYPIRVDGALVCTYKPDFIVTMPGGNVEIHEVKGRMTSDFSLKLRLLKAAWVPTLDPMYSYWIVMKKGTEWQKKPVEPAKQTTPATS